jgi:hypothetical protein
MAQDNTPLVSGIRYFHKNDKQPEWVLGELIITPDDLNAFCIDNPGLMTEYNGNKQLKLQILKSKDGKPYLKVNTWQPAAPAPASQQGFATEEVEDISQLPF